jgi:hypothetical protein
MYGAPHICIAIYNIYIYIYAYMGIPFVDMFCSAQGLVNRAPSEHSSQAQVLVMRAQVLLICFCSIPAMAVSDSQWESQSEHEHSIESIGPANANTDFDPLEIDSDPDRFWPSLQPSQRDDASSNSIGDRTPSRARSHNSWTSIGLNDDSDERLGDFDAESNAAEQQIVLHPASSQHSTLAILEPAAYLPLSFYFESLVSCSPDDLGNARHILALALGPLRYSYFDEMTPSGQTYKYLFDVKLNAALPICRGSTWTAESRAAGVFLEDGNASNAIREYKSRYLEIAELLFLSSRMMWAAYVSDVKRQIESGEKEGILCLHNGANDAASFKLVLSSGVAAAPEDDASAPPPPPSENSASATAGKAQVTAKVMQSEVRNTVLLRDRRTGKYSCHSGAVPCPLYSTDRSTSEISHAMHNLIYTMWGFDYSFYGKFKQVVVNHTQDAPNSNLKQINAARKDNAAAVAAGNKKKNILPLQCDIHKAASNNTKSWDLTKGDISGCLALAIAETEPGRFEALLDIVGDRCVSKLHIIRCCAFLMEAVLCTLTCTCPYVDVVARLFFSSS